jgi:hypothetical protein
VPPGDSSGSGRSRGPLLAGDRVVLIANNRQALAVKETPEGRAICLVDLEDALSTHALWEVRAYSRGFVACLA